MILLIKLMLAHLLGDFLLQPGSWVRAKEQKKLRAVPLYLHALLHGALIMLLVWNITFWPWALLLSMAHFIIDTLKLYLQKNDTRRIAFFIDQAAHIVTIITTWMYSEQLSINFQSINYGFLLLLATLVYLLTQPVSMAIAIIISKWTPETGDTADDSLQNAGKYIGFLERLLVFLFIIASHWEAVGFLVTAKSVFRFGDLKAAKDRKLTEYVLIGTLLSFGTAILLGMLFRECLTVF